MRRMLFPLMAAGMLVLGSAGASAQGFDVRIGVGDPGYRTVQRRVYRDYDDGYYGRRVVERRYFAPTRSRVVCRTVIRERIRPSGAVVRRPIQVCDRVYGGRRFYYR
jgi:hypothetical protein